MQAAALDVAIERVADGIPRGDRWRGTSGSAAAWLSGRPVLVDATATERRTAQIETVKPADNWESFLGILGNGAQKALMQEQKQAAKRL